MPWDDELEVESGYTRRRDPDYFDTDAFFRHNQNTIMCLDKEMTSLKKRIAYYERKLILNPKNNKLKEYLDKLDKHRRQCEKNLYYFEDVVSGYSN